jgi:hypothetical protein
MALMIIELFPYAAFLGAAGLVGYVAFDWYRAKRGTPAPAGLPGDSGRENAGAPAPLAQRVAARDPYAVSTRRIVIMDGPIASPAETPVSPPFMSSVILDEADEALAETEIEAPTSLGRELFEPDPVPSDGPVLMSSDRLALVDDHAPVPVVSDLSRNLHNAQESGEQVAAGRDESVRVFDTSLAASRRLSLREVE